MKTPPLRAIDFPNDLCLVEENGACVCLFGGMLTMTHLLPSTIICCRDRANPYHGFALQLILSALQRSWRRPNGIKA